MKLSLHSFTLKIKERFTIAHHSRDAQEVLVVGLHAPDAQGNPPHWLGRDHLQSLLSRGR